VGGHGGPAARRGATGDGRRPNARPLVLALLGLATISTAFPLVASVLPAADLPAWLGPLDVACAGALLLAAIAVARRAGQPDGEIVATCFRLYRAAAGLLLALLAAFLVVGDAIRWDVLVPGLAWRGWLLVHVLPGALSLWRDGATGRDAAP
jgi:hypothetical protein